MGNLRFKIDWASLIAGSKFTVLVLFYFVFEGNFPSTNHRGGGGTLYNDLGGEAPPGRGTFFRLQGSERVGISLVQVDKRAGNLSFRSVKRLKNG